MSFDARGYRKHYQDKSTNLQVTTSTDDSTLITVKSADHQLFIQRIVVTPTTYSAKTWSFEDSNGTPKPIALISIPAAAPTTAGDASFVLDFGAQGVPLTVGKNLVLNVSATGAAGMIAVEGYQKLANVVAAASTN